MLWQDSIDDSTSSEDDLDDLLLEFMFPLQNDASYPRVNLQDIPVVQCEAMFRFAKGDMERLRRITTASQLHLQSKDYCCWDGGTDDSFEKTQLMEAWKCFWFPLSSLDMKQLTLKTVALIALNSAQRSQTLAALDVGLMKSNEKGSEFEKLKARKIAYSTKIFQPWWPGCKLRKMQSEALVLCIIQGESQLPAETSWVKSGCRLKGEPPQNIRM